MKIFLIIVLIVVTLTLWLFATALLENSKNTNLSFIDRSVSYWIAIILSFTIGICCS